MTPRPRMGMIAHHSPLGSIAAAVAMALQHAQVDGMRSGPVSRVAPQPKISRPMTKTGKRQQERYARRNMHEQQQRCHKKEES